MLGRMAGRNGFTFRIAVQQAPGEGQRPVMYCCGLVEVAPEK
jgi:hypothetical protein